MNKEQNLSIAVIILSFIIILMFALTIWGFKQGKMIGSLTTTYNIKGTEGICDIVNKTMEDTGYCLLKDDGQYKHYFDCSRGKFTAQSNHSRIRWYEEDPRWAIMQCDRIKVVEVT